MEFLLIINGIVQLVKIAGYINAIRNGSHYARKCYDFYSYVFSKREKNKNIF